MFESDPAEAPTASEFVERMLRANPDASFATVKERAIELGLNVPPYLYGATRRRLGLPTRPGEDDDGGSRADRPGSSDPAAGGAVPEADAPDDEAPDGDIADGDIADGDIADDDTAGDDRAAQGTAAGPAAAKARPKPPSGFQFAVEVLRMSPDISFRDLKARAALEGYKLQPIVYGRAKALLGLVPTRPRRRKAPPQQLRQVDSASEVQLPRLDSTSSVEQLVRTVRALDGECRRLRQALKSVFEVVDAALQDDDAAP